MSDSHERLQKLKETLLQTEILAQFGGSLVSPEASEFVANLMRNWYAIDNDGRFETNDETPLGMDLKPLPVDQIGNYLREKHDYLFRESRPAFVSNATTVAPPPPNKAQMSLAEKCQFIRVNGEQAFLDLPNDPVAAQPLAERPRSSWSVEEKADFVRRFGSEAYLALP